MSSPILLKPANQVGREQHKYDDDKHGHEIHVTPSYAAFASLTRSVSFALNLVANDV